MNNKVPECVDVSFNISTSNKYLHYGIRRILENIMSQHFNGVTYVKCCCRRNYNTTSIYTFHIIEVNSSSIINEFVPHSSLVGFCFIIPESTYRHINKGKTEIYVHQSLRIVEQELTDAIKTLIRPKSSRSGSHSRNSNLTPRQKEVLHYLIKGVPVDEIARKTNITVKTVYSLRRTVYSRLGVRNMADFYKHKHLIDLLYSRKRVMGPCDYYSTSP